MEMGNQKKRVTTIKMEEFCLEESGSLTLKVLSIDSCSANEKESVFLQYNMVMWRW